LDAKFDFRVTIPGNCYTSEYCYPEMEQFPSNNTRKFAISGYCYPEIEVSLFLSCTISGYCYSEFDKFPIIDSQKFSNFWELLLGNCQFPGNNTQKFDNFQLPGNNTWKLTKRQKCWVNFRATIPGYFQFQSIVTRKLINFQVTIQGNCTFSEYCYPEVALKKYYFREYLGENENIFENI